MERKREKARDGQRQTREWMRHREGHTYRETRAEGMRGANLLWKTRAAAVCFIFQFSLSSLLSFTLSPLMRLPALTTFTLSCTQVTGTV